jgi:purine-nucleoside phosphorylase
MSSNFDETIAFLKGKGIDAPAVGIILGTGLNSLLAKVEISVSILYNEIPHFPISTVEFHKGNLIFGHIGLTPVVVMQGRFHFYEGYTMEQIVYPVRIMKLMGIQRLLISNAAGGINNTYKKGDLIVIDDHINLQGSNPLIGKNIDELGPRYPDMSEPYDRQLNEMLFRAAKEENLLLKQGVYAAVNGPNLETRAEYRFLMIIGADMVGMSTVSEVIAANHMKLPCAAISVITDECDPDNLKPVNIEDIIKTAVAADTILTRLLVSVIKSIEIEEHILS